MASDSAFHYSYSSSNDEDALNNTQIGPTLMEQHSDDGSIASSGSNDSNEPAAATAPPHSPQALQLKKQQCCDLFIHTFCENYIKPTRNEAKLHEAEPANQG